MTMLFLSCSSFLLLLLATSALATVPVVTWHGLGGTASECERMIETIREAAPDVHVINVAVGVFVLSVMMSYGD